MRLATLLLAACATAPEITEPLECPDVHQPIECDCVRDGDVDTDTDPDTEADTDPDTDTDADTDTSSGECGASTATSFAVTTTFVALTVNYGISGLTFEPWDADGTPPELVICPAVNQEYLCSSPFPMELDAWGAPRVWPDDTVTVTLDPALSEHFKIVLWEDDPGSTGVLVGALGGMDLDALRSIAGCGPQSAVGLGPLAQIVYEVEAL